jgi:hypothetical protein
MTSYYTGVSPNEHAWLGWSLFFKEFCRTIDVYTNLDSYTKTPVVKTSAAEFVMPYETIYHSIEKSIIGDVQPFTISQTGVNIAERGNIHKTLIFCTLQVLAKNYGHAHRKYWLIGQNTYLYSGVHKKHPW